MVLPAIVGVQAEKQAGLYPEHQSGSNQYLIYSFDYKLVFTI